MSECESCGGYGGKHNNEDGLCVVERLAIVEAERDALKAKLAEAEAEIKRYNDGLHYNQWSLDTLREQVAPIIAIGLTPKECLAERNSLKEENERLRGEVERLRAGLYDSQDEYDKLRAELEAVRDCHGGDKDYIVELRAALKKAVEAFNDIKKKAEFQVEIATEADKVVATAGQITYAVAVIMSDPTIKRLMAKEGR